MEEKKEIKVKLSTVIILFLILIIIGLVALLYLQSNKIDNTNNQIANNNIESALKNNNLTNKSENPKNKEIEEDSNLKSEKLIQFDTEFFKLEDVAIIAKELNEPDEKVTYNYDLDGDEIKEEITVEDNTEDYTFKLNGIEFYKNSAFEFYIVDLNENDEALEVIITTYAGSDRSDYLIFSKVGNKMEQLETNMSGVTGEFMLDRKGKIVSGKFASFVKPSVYSEYYVFENGKIIENKLDINDIKDVEFEAEYNTYYFSKEIDTLNKIEDYMDGR